MASPPTIDAVADHACGEDKYVGNNNNGGSSNDDSDNDSFHSVPSLSQSAVMVFSSPLFSSAHSTGSDWDRPQPPMSGSLEEQDTAAATAATQTPAATAAAVGRSVSNPDDGQISPDDSMYNSLTTINSIATGQRQKSVETTSGGDDLLESPWKVISETTETKRPSVNCVAFNQVRTCVCIATGDGYRVRTVPDVSFGSATRPPTEGEVVSSAGEARQQRVMVHQSAVAGGVSFCQMLHNTSLVAIVKTSAPRCVSLVNAKTGESLRDLFFVAAVRRVDMNRRCVTVLSADGKIHVFELESMNLLKSLDVLHSSESWRSLSQATASAAGAFFDLSRVDDEPWLVCRSSEGVGCLRIFDGRDMSLVNNTKAHDHSIARLAIGGRKGEQRLATASQQGTVIRVFSLPRFKKLCTLWRGSNPCTMFSIAFNESATQVAVSGSSGTIHIFKIVVDGDTAGGGGGSSSDASRQEKSSVANRIFGQRGLSYFFPDSVTDKTDSLRSYAKVKLKQDKAGGRGGSDKPTLLALMETESWEVDESDRTSLVVCTENAMMFRFTVDSTGAVQPASAEDMLFDE